MYTGTYFEAISANVYGVKNAINFRGSQTFKTLHIEFGCNRERETRRNLGDYKWEMDLIKKTGKLEKE